LVRAEAHKYRPVTPLAAAQPEALPSTFAD
jgi:hypothetical protein